MSGPLESRLSRLERSKGAASGWRAPGRTFVVAVRMWRREEDLSAAFAAAGVDLIEGDIVRPILYECQGQPRAAGFVPRITHVGANAREPVASKEQREAATAAFLRADT